MLNLNPLPMFTIAYTDIVTMVQITYEASVSHIWLFFSGQDIQKCLWFSSTVHALHDCSLKQVSRYAPSYYHWKTDFHDFSWWCFPLRQPSGTVNSCISWLFPQACVQGNSIHKVLQRILWKVLMHAHSVCTRPFLLPSKGLGTRLIPSYAW